ncbi:MAG: 3-mercaptopyruvate sulfurtransferase [Alphaproteobacteria bacterium]|nr:3-mercaptopyruvate sulfurtransferase [Alphaproteobacteria bacterium]
MSYVNPDSLVSTKWLADHLSAPDVLIVDAGWFLPGEERNGQEEYKNAHIPGAVFFDIDGFADTKSDLPHMLPGPDAFSSMMGHMGIGTGHRIVVYDRHGLFSAARVWWTLCTFGHDEVAILDGGFPKWQREGRPISNLPIIPRERPFRARLNNLMVRDLAQVRKNIDTSKAQLLDARGAARFKGEAPEPREDLRSGHIPGSLNLPYTELSDPEDGTVLDAEALTALFDAAGINRVRPVITTCGSGITACVLAFGLHLLGHKDVAVYDGSWAEWGSRDDTPIET